MEAIEMKNNKLLIATSLTALLTTGTVGTLSTTQNILANESKTTQTNSQTTLEKPEGEGQGAPGKPGEGGFGGSGKVNQGSSANTIVSDEDKKDETFTSTGDDENSLRVKGAKVNLENVEVNKTGGSTSNTEEGDFYGMWFKKSHKYASDSPEYNEGVIKEADNVLTEKMMRKGMLTFAEVLDILGFEVPKAALPFGWTDTDGFYLEWDAHEVWNDDKQENEIQFYVRWKLPRNLYATTNFHDFVPKKTRKELN